MPYTRPWNDTALGSEAANTIDDIISAKMADIHERMDDVVVDWTADPVVPLGVGTLTSSKRITYQDSLDAGEKASSFDDTFALMTVVLTGTTSGSGLITFNFNEINVGSGDTLNYQVLNGAGIISWMGNRTDGVPVFMRVVGTSTSANTMTLEFRHGDGAIVASLAIVGTLIISSIDNPVV